MATTSPSENEQLRYFFAYVVTFTDSVLLFLQAFASGTFVYVIFIEIIPHEFISAKSEKRLIKLSCLALGFAGMAGLQAIPHTEE